MEREQASRNQQAYSAPETGLPPEVLAGFYQNAPLPAHALDHRGAIVFVNDAWLALLGYTRGEVSGQAFADIVAADWQPGWQAICDTLLVDGVVHNSEIELRPRTGSPVPVIYCGRADYDGHGRFRGSSCILRDAREQRQQQLEREQLVNRLQALTTERDVASRRDGHQLPASLEALRNILRNLPLGVAVYSTAGALMHYNPALENLLGECQPISMLARLGGEQQAEDSIVASARMMVKATLKDGTTALSRTARVNCVDGKTRFVTLSAAPLKREDGAVDGALLVLEDNTDKTNLEEALRRKERLASVGILAAGIAHEINNPLAAILTIARYLTSQRSIEPGSLINKGLSDISQEAHRCSEIVKNILRFARNEVTLKAPTSLNDALSKGAGLCREFARDNQVEVRLELAKDAPLVVANSIQMQQVVVNLLRNAIQATTLVKRDSKRIALIRSMAGAGESCLRIEDNGPGFNAEQKEHLFDPFYTTKRKVGGTGLGLSICYGIVSEHNGRIEVGDSALGGACVSVTLPVYREERQPE